MTIADGLFALVIGPLKILFELIYVFVYKLTQNPGLSIIGLSLVMNFLLLPLYNQTDAIQLEAIETEKRLKPFVSHIKKTFKGNEQFMMLQTCYRQNHYKPTDALKGISPLLLEIPFFMAAYNYLSNLGLLHEATLGPIRDLGAPDGLLVIGGLAINLLPLLMTAINILSSLIYTKGAPLKAKLQLYGMAAVFLVLLYDSPSGLVFYWTLNNLFSLVKNIFLKLRNPKKVLAILASLAGAAALVTVTFFRRPDTALKYAFVLLLFLALQLPLARLLLRKPRSAPAPVSSGDRLGFFLSCGFLAILMGILIPSAVIKASPAEFVDFTKLNPLYYVFTTFLQAAGTFLIWLPVFYTISSSSGKRFLSLGLWLVACAAITDYMFFGADYGTLQPDLTYIVQPQFGKSLPNILLIAAVTVAAFYLHRKKPRLVRFSCSVLSLAILMMSMLNIAGIQKGYRETVSAMHSGSSSDGTSIIPLNKGGKNVIVLMLDRSISSYIPYFMNEKPELREQFAGFTYYPNTTSFGPTTNVGTPPLFGGYDYTPENINRRNTESLASKQNEALKVMPVLFSEQDFQVTVCDPSYAGYQWIPDLSIYDEYRDISAYRAYEHCSAATSGSYSRKRRAEKCRNFIYYSLMRVVPVVGQPVIYNGGNYNAFKQEDPSRAFVVDGDIAQYVGTQEQTDCFHASGIRESFYRYYTVLDKLDELTRIQDESFNTFMMMSNDATHEECLLQEPEYIPVPQVDNTAYEAAHADRYTLNGRTMKMEDIQDYSHYQVNMASIIKVGQWLDYLRANHVYDNSRIIIVSDHGNRNGQFDELVWGKEYYQDAQSYNSLLMVKDFGATDFTTDNTFMTVADVPAMATAGLIRDPVNPFTGNPINCDGKSEPIKITYTNSHIAENNGNTFQEGPWVSVHDDIWNKDNWSVLSPGP